MQAESMGWEIDRCALLIVDMQNDFLHRDGSFAHLAREHPEAKIDMPFLIGTIPNVTRLADAFRVSGKAGFICRASAEARLFRRRVSVVALGNGAGKRQPHALC